MTNRKIFVLSVCLILISGFVFKTWAQGPEPAKKYTISGKVIDDELGVPLEYATVSIVNVNDPNDINGGVTNAEGAFAIEVQNGTYNIAVEFISYETKNFNNRTINSDLDLGTIKLGLGSENLDEVVVQAETTQVDVRLDKKIYNIGKDLTTAGGTVSDALNNVPSVSVDVEGGISLRGNENVRILINGKPSAMAGFGDSNVLSQLPASAIERVEVITSPSARYDAEGTAGILNIILRKKETLGFNGSLNLQTGYPANGGISANLNYRTEKYNLFATTGYRYDESPGNANFDTRYFDVQQDAFLDSIQYTENSEDRDYDRIRRNFNTNLGMEYYITDMSSITGSVFYRKGNDDDLTTNISDYFLNGSPQIGTTRYEKETEDEDSYQIALNYINKFDNNGHQLTADFQYESDQEEQGSFINEPVRYNNTDSLGVNIPREQTSTIEDQNQYLIQADYVRPIGEESQFEAGYRGEFENTLTDYKLFQENADGTLVLNENQTNIFDYTENVQAVYSQYGSKFGEFSFLLGLRLENTNLKGNITSALTEAELQDIYSFEIDTEFDNNYLGLFPTVNLIYELGEDENITLGYNRRINRPRGWFINPFPSRSSRNNVFQGNPNLRPAFSNAFDLGYLKKWDKLTLTSSVYYQHETDAFSRIQERVNITVANPSFGEAGEPEYVNQEVIRSIPFNLATNDRMGGEIGFLYNPNDWLRLNGSFNYFRFELDGQFNGTDYSQKNTSYFGRFSSKVSLPWKIDWQTNAFYRGPSDDVQGTQDGILSIDVALSKEVLKDKATVSINARDLLNSRKRSQQITTDDFYQESEFQWRQRQINLSFIYRFNQQKKRNERRGGEDNMMDEDGEGF
ncbi:MAG: TonB-dependent receptor [Bacteroidota bacterium]|uniref:TonB-dependent receptor, putative n=1 Tax=Christiangramia flava JLT2011 TaxID=1229726 RepID=A0A1L7IAV3_9FLAO|nr:TonB-dependent receptor [Christiangramia flava]APU70262.1 TonB-dependent receptor, putative [Christiangramia flava JLT2011]MAM20097.1 TonB-dependent receptor [Christiangramia sp.]MEE2772545.1 TonB-dependent receptor [Bacteroidota bacterium]OSS39748.1 TonB-dependent receptor domain protein [Christiangramia flava JLT2011]